ncbi:hypothetical protein, partial [Dialister invisus]|uniref:hypothetical protein n=1 Tax=Dialister invisus TaxID=218538 RepID=UPI003AB19F0C
TAANSSLALTRGRLTFPVIVTLSFNRHSEWTQECFVRKTENGTVTQSEESMTLMTSYCSSSFGQAFFILKVIFL